MAIPANNYQYRTVDKGGAETGPRGQPWNPGTPPNPQSTPSGPPTSGPGSQGWEDFMKVLQQQQAGLGRDIRNLRGYRSQIGDLDPALAGIQEQFGLMGQGQDPYLDRLRAQAVEDQRRNLALRGVEGSVAQNEMVGTQGQYDLMGLGRRDAALGQQAGIINQRAGLYGMGAGITGQISDTRGGIIQNQSIVPTLDIGWLAAQNAGKGGDKSGGRGPFGLW